jgi:hypothetical protein
MPSSLGFNQPNPVTLDTPAQTAVFPVYNQDMATVAYTISGINTNVTLAIEGSSNDQNWFPLVANQTHTLNGTYAPVTAQWVALSSLRVRFVSETGGTSAVIAVHPCFN